VLSDIVEGHVPKELEALVSVGVGALHSLPTKNCTLRRQHGAAVHMLCNATTCCCLQAEAERQVADQELQAVENGARRTVARLPTFYRDIQARVKEIMVGGCASGG
jgi:hypothetical protein